MQTCRPASRSFSRKDRTSASLTSSEWLSLLPPGSRVPPTALRSCLTSRKSSTRKSAPTSPSPPTPRTPSRLSNFCRMAASTYRPKTSRSGFSVPRPSRAFSRPSWWSDQRRPSLCPTSPSSRSWPSRPSPKLRCA